MSAIRKAPTRSIPDWVRALAFAVKKSTMMLPRLAWHKGMNIAMAAPAATPVSSKAPTMETPTVLRPIRLPHVMSVMPVSSTPARMAQRFASGSRIRKRPSSAASGGLDLDRDVRQAADAAHQRVPGHDGRDAFRRARVHQVAGLQFPGGGQVLDDFPDAPDQLGDIAALP